MATQVNSPWGYLDDEQKTVEEALKRGASEIQLTAWLLWRRRSRQLPVPDPLAARAETLRTQESLRHLIKPQVVQYQNMITAEFNSLKIQFSDPDKQRSDLTHYSLLRPRYYTLGYTYPVKDIFSKIQSFHFLGNNVPGGLHSVFANVLALVDGILDAVAPGLSQRVASSILAQDGGFVPRSIANTDVLSNHAFGLALDIDPLFNPHVVGKDVLAILNEVVSKRKGIDFNFDERYTARLVGNRLLTDEGRTKVTFLYARMASDAVKEWLTENLDTYEQCLAQIAAGKQAATGSNDDVLGKNARDAITSNRDLQLIGRIAANGISLKTLHAWAQYGIQTIPVELALAIEKAMQMKGFPRNRRNRPWGQEWEKSKDAMHFELAYDEAIPPDSPKRPLKELLPSYYFPELEEIRT